MEYSSASCAKESFEIVRKLKLSSMANFSNFFCPTHVRPEDFRNFDTAVFTLVVLQYCNNRPADSKSRTVERVNELWPFRSPVADVGSPCLEIIEIRARRDFSILFLCRYPYFEVVSLGSRESQIASTEAYYPIW